MHSIDQLFFWNWNTEDRQVKLSLNSRVKISLSPWIRGVIWTCKRHPEDIQEVFWTSYVRSIYVLCPGWLFYYKNGDIYMQCKPLLSYSVFFYFPFLIWKKSKYFIKCSTIKNWLQVKLIRESEPSDKTPINLLHPSILFICTLKTLKNVWFSYVFMGYRNRDLWYLLLKHK